MMNAIKNRLIEQGYSLQDVNNNSINIIALSRWTPFSCAFLGIIGLLIQSPLYFLVLGLLTTIGAFRPRSFYDYAYVYFFSYFIKLGEMPKHNIHRRIGCSMGAVIYLTTSFGFYIQNMYLAYIPSLMIITIAIFAGISGWCFVTEISNLFNRKKKEACC